LALTIQLLLPTEAAKKSRLLTPDKTAYRQDKNAGKQQGAKEKAKRSKTGAKQGKNRSKKS
jgi:hypothetical protein